MTSEHHYCWMELDIAEPGRLLTPRSDTTKYESAADLLFNSKDDALAWLDEELAAWHDGDEPTDADEVAYISSWVLCIRNVETVPTAAQGTERFLRFLCVLFDLHAEQYPGDVTPKAEAERLEHSIELAQVEAMPPSPEKAKRLYELQGWLTVGQLREAIQGEPDDKLVTIYDGNWYKHAEIISSEQPGETEPTLVLAATSPFDTRDL